MLDLNQIYVYILLFTRLIVAGIATLEFLHSVDSSSTVIKIVEYFLGVLLFLLCLVMIQVIPTATGQVPAVADDAEKLLTTKGEQEKNTGGDEQAGKDFWGLSFDFNSLPVVEAVDREVEVSFSNIVYLFLINANLKTRWWMPPH